MSGPVGNGNALVHGLYAVVAHREDVDAVANYIRPLLPKIHPDVDPSFELMVRAAALLACQIFGPSENFELGSRESKDLNTKLAEFRRQLETLGMTPTSSARFVRDAQAGALSGEQLAKAKRKRQAAERRHKRAA